MKKKALITFLFFTCAISIEAQVNAFPRVFIDSLDHGIQLHASVLTADGGLLMVGEHYGEKSLLVKMDSSGKLVWNKVFGGKTVYQPDIVFETIVSTNDSCYLIAGNAYNKTTHLRDALILKINSNGDTLWHKVFSKTFQNFDIYSINQTLDSGYVFCGYAQQLGLANRKVFVGKCDLNGTLQWARYFNDGINDFIGSCIKQTVDSGYILIGDIQANALLLKLSPTGILQWARKFNYPKTGGSTGNDIQIANDGFVCSLNSKQAPVLKTDLLGNVQWCITFPTLPLAQQITGYTFPRFCMTADSSYIKVNGDCFSFGRMIKVNNKGKKVWSTGLYLIPLEVKESKNKELMITGNGPICGVGPGFSRPQIGILKSDSSGNVIDCGSSISIDTGSYTPVNTQLTLVTDSEATVGSTNLSTANIWILGYSDCIYMIGGIEKAAVKNRIRISPNPSGGIFKIDTREPKPTQLIIYNSIGDIIFQSNFQGPAFEIDLSSKPRGIYFYTLINKDNIAEKGKLVIEN